MAEGMVLGPGEGRRISVGADRATIKAEGSYTDDALAVIEYTAAPGVPGPPPHVHTDGLHELWYVLEGELEFQHGDTTTPAPAGSFVHVPPGRVHTFANTSHAPARFIGIFSPGKGLAMLEELGKVLPEDGSPPDMDALMRVFASHGAEVIGGPPGS